MSQEHKKMSREEIEKEANDVIQKYKILMSNEEKVCLYNAMEGTGLFSEDMVLAFYYGLQSKPVAVQTSLKDSKLLLEEAANIFRSQLNDITRTTFCKARSRVVLSTALNVSEHPRGLKVFRWEATFE